MGEEAKQHWRGEKWVGGIGEQVGGKLPVQVRGRGRDVPPVSAPSAHTDLTDPASPDQDPTRPHN